MALTQKQESFCLAYIESGNASEAYRRVYNAQRMKPATINRRATELMQNGTITARLEELRAPIREAAGITLQKHLQALADLRDKAAREGQYAAAISAEISRGKASGLYVERKEISSPGGTPLEIIISYGDDDDTDDENE